VNDTKRIVTDVQAMGYLACVRRDIENNNPHLALRDVQALLDTREALLDALERSHPRAQAKRSSCPTCALLRQARGES
jgi:hypothetical protein